VLPVGSIIEDGATATGFMAAAIAVGGFLGHAGPVLWRRGEAAIRVGTVFGGPCGLAIAIFVPVAIEVL
jgi:hypothetical protein